MDYSLLLAIHDVREHVVEDRQSAVLHTTSNKIKVSISNNGIVNNKSSDDDKKKPQLVDVDNMKTNTSVNSNVHVQISSTHNNNDTNNNNAINKTDINTFKQRKQSAPTDLHTPLLERKTFGGPRTHTHTHISKTTPSWQVPHTEFTAYHGGIRARVS